MGLAAAHKLNRLIDRLQRIPADDGRIYKARGHHGESIPRVLTGAVPRANDLQFALGDLNGVDGGKIRFFTDDDNLAAAPCKVSRRSHRRRGADTIENAMRAFAAGKFFDLLSGMGLI